MFEELDYTPYSELSSYTTQDRAWLNNPVVDEPFVMNRSVRFKEPITETVVFDKDSPPIETPTFTFQIACDTVRPVVNQSSLFLIR